MRQLYFNLDTNYLGSLKSNRELFITPKHLSLTPNFLRASCHSERAMKHDPLLNYEPRRGEPL